MYHQTKSICGYSPIIVRMCNATNAESVTLIAQDEAKIQTGYPVIITVSAGNNNTGNIKACFDSLSDLEFVNYTIGDTIYHSYFAPGNTIIQSTDPPGSYIFISGSNTVYGGGVSFKISNFGIAQGSNKGLDEFTSPEVNWSVVQPAFVSIPEYGAIGGYISGHFTGQVEQSYQSQVPRKVTCNFRVKRTQ